MPDASPPSSGRALEMAVCSEGMNASAMPAAATSDAGSTSTTKEPLARTSEHEQSADDHALGADAGHDPRGNDDHAEHDGHGHGQQRGPALEGAEAEDLLEVEVQEEPHRHPGS